MHYLVTFGEYSDKTVLGVFSTLEGAKGAGIAYASDSYHYCADLYEFELDKGYGWNDYPKALFYGVFTEIEDGVSDYALTWKPA
jgi:hypothetical protein